MFVNSVLNAITKPMSVINTMSNVNEIARGIAEKLRLSIFGPEAPIDEMDSYIPMLAAALREYGEDCYRDGYDGAEKDAFEIIDLAAKKADAEGFSRGLSHRELYFSKELEKEYRRGVEETEKKYLPRKKLDPPETLADNLHKKHGTGGGE